MTSLRATVYVASSLNGFMTRGESDSDWVSVKDERIFAEHCAKEGALIVGRKTFEQYHGSVYPVPDTLNVVLSHTEKKDNHFASLQEACDHITDYGFKRCIVVGGSSVIALAFKAGIVDEVVLSLHPYLFSAGLPALPVFKDIDLEFQEVIMAEPELVLIKYKVK